MNIQLEKQIRFIGIFTEPSGFEYPFEIDTQDKKVYWLDMNPESFGDGNDIDIEVEIIKEYEKLI